MSLMYAEASISEKGTINGAKGDSTGKEVKISKPYTHSKGWRAFIYPTASVNKIVGIRAREIAQNDCFGYGQSDRTSGYLAVKNAKWKPANVITKANIDCSELVRTAVACALGKEVVDFNTSIEPNVLLSLGYKEVTFNINKLQHGMILCTKVKGHTCVVTDTSITESTTTAKATTTSGTKYKVICASLTVRSIASTGGQAVDYVHNGETYTVTKTSNGWGYIAEKKGWVSLNSKYIVAVK